MDLFYPHLPGVLLKQSSKETTPDRCNFPLACLWWHFLGAHGEEDFLSPLLAPGSTGAVLTVGLGGALRGWCCPWLDPVLGVMAPQGLGVLMPCVSLLEGLCRGGWRAGVGLMTQTLVIWLIPAQWLELRSYFFSLSR